MQHYQHRWIWRRFGFPGKSKQKVRQQRSPQLADDVSVFCPSTLTLLRFACRPIAFVVEICLYT